VGAAAADDEAADEGGPVVKRKQQQQSGKQLQQQETASSAGGRDRPAAPSDSTNKAAKVCVCVCRGDCSHLLLRCIMRTQKQRPCI
jgi:hypothetical protein